MFGAASGHGEEDHNCIYAQNGATVFAGRKGAGNAGNETKNTTYINLDIMPSGRC